VNLFSGFYVMQFSQNQILKPIKRLIKATHFWQDNVLIFQELRHFPLTIALALIFPIIAAGFEGFGVSFLLGFLQNLLNEGGKGFETGLEWLDIWILGVNQSDFSRLCRVAALILLSAWLRAFFTYLTLLYMKASEEKLINRLYKQVYEQIQALSLSFYSKAQIGSVLNTMTSEVAQMRQSIGALSILVIRGSVVIMYAVLALWISWPLTLMAIMLLTLAAVGLSNLTRRVRSASFPITQARKQYINLVKELLSGIRTVKAYATEDYERQRIYNASDQVMQAGMVMARKLAIVKPLSEALATSILISLIIVAVGLFVENGLIQVASLLTFLFLLFRMVPILQQLNSSFATLASFQGALQSLQELLRRDDKPYLPNGYRPFHGIQSAMEFVAVDFGYEAGRTVLHNISLSLEQGKTTALVGGSGAGKSTLADLIMRFYDPTRGNILAGGINLKEFDLHSLRSKIAIVSQDTFIFNTSVKDNICYGSQQAPQAEVMRAAKLAHALDFIEELPQGFETILGDRGTRLSGGQRQRIAIARALLKDPEILILDEATSALDSVSERLIQDALEDLSVGRTVIAIAHRLSTISKADRVIVLEQGQIVEQGDYQELLNRRGKLWSYHQMQFEASQSS
jgi:subfamily B ATP-binding cassette protein MsbA